tara:strand:+ start:628 stop:741 length:114 start_codon:yes stop_codon:yes gene_type:complete
MNVDYLKTPTIVVGVVNYLNKNYARYIRNKTNECRYR